MTECAEEPAGDTPGGTGSVTVLVATPLEAALVTRIGRGEPRAEVLYAPDLLPAPRYPGDHRGEPDFCRSPAAEARWQELLRRAEALFGIPGDSPDGLAHAVAVNPSLRWVQATAAGAGEQVRAAGLSAVELERVVVTSASGVHAVPLAEFCLFGLLAFSRELPRMLVDQREHSWEHRPVSELHGRTLLVLGLGSIGREVARLARAFGMRVVGVNRDGRGASGDVERVVTPAQLSDVLGSADAVVVTLPLTDETRGMLDAGAVAAMKRGAIIVNVGRGGVVDEDALIAALEDGRLTGAALDVFAAEPLPADSPLWRLPNVIVSPHTAALSVRENERIVELFIANLRRYLAGRDLVNRVELGRGY